MWLALGVPTVFAILITVRPDGGFKWILAPVLLIGLLAVARDAVPWPGMTRAIQQLAEDGVNVIVDSVVAVAKPTDSAAIDAVFGPKAGSQISEAHGLLVELESLAALIERHVNIAEVFGNHGIPARQLRRLEEPLPGALQVDQASTRIGGSHQG